MWVLSKQAHTTATPTASALDKREKAQTKVEAEVKNPPRCLLSSCTSSASRSFIQCLVDSMG